MYLSKRDGTGKWQFFGNNETRTVDSLLIGSLSIAPDTTLHVYRGDSGGASHSYAGLTIEDDTNVHLQFLTPNANYAGIKFGDPEDSGTGQINYYHNLNELWFTVNGSSVNYINSSNQIVNTLSTGIAPFVVSSRTPVVNLRVEGVDIVATGSLPAAGASQDGKVIIENVGAGDQNLIIYSNGQRFRINGGTGF